MTCKPITYLESSRPEPSLPPCQDCCLSYFVSLKLTHRARLYVSILHTPKHILVYSSCLYTFFSHFYFVFPLCSFFTQGLASTRTSGRDWHLQHKKEKKIKATPDYRKYTRVMVAAQVLRHQ